MTRKSHPNITTILFDLGEVVFTNDWTFYCPEKDQEFQSHYQCPDFVFTKSSYFNDLYTGKITEEEYWKKSLQEVEAKTTDPQKAIEISHKYQREKPGMLNLIKTLKRNGYKLGVITNTYKEMLKWKIEKFELASYFQEIIASCDIGFEKPDKRIYQEALEKMGSKPHESIFIDDQMKNVEGAKKLNIHTIYFQSYDQLVSELEKFGINS